MPATIRYRKQNYEVKSGMTVRRAMLKLGFQPEALLAVREDELITEDEIIQEGDLIRLIGVISGGDR